MVGGRRARGERVGYILVPASSFSPIFVHRPAFVLSVPSPRTPHVLSPPSSYTETSTSHHRPLRWSFNCFSPHHQPPFPSFPPSKTRKSPAKVTRLTIPVCSPSCSPTLFQQSFHPLPSSWTIPQLLGRTLFYCAVAPQHFPSLIADASFFCQSIDDLSMDVYFTFLPISLSSKTGVSILMSNLEYISNDDILKNNERDFIQSKNKKGRKME